ncbi:antigen p97 (melanoma associated) identified by monoclonal antibodies 133.2 and 96.5 [Chamberlinius hualienensis]
MKTTILILYISVLSSIKGQLVERPKDTVRWCAVGEQELKKCEDFAVAVESSRRFTLSLQCVPVLSKDECFHKIDNYEADLITLDPGEVYVAGRYHSMIPISTEVYGRALEKTYFAVAVVNRSSPIQSMNDFRGRRACFSGVGQMAGWVLPISTLLRNRVMEVTDCNNHLKSAADFFGSSCAPNALNDKNNPTGDNPVKLCDRCGTDHDTKCLDSDQFAGFGGAFQCLLGNRGDIAFVKHTTIDLMAQVPGLKVDKNFYELVCPNGYRRAPITEYRTCNWGQVPAHAVVTSSEMSQDMIRRFQDFIKLAVNMFGSTGQFSQPPQPPPRFGPQPQTPSPLQSNQFRLFGYFNGYEQRYGNRFNLLFQDDTAMVEPIPEGKQTFKDYIGNLEEAIMELRQCPSESVKFCVVSDVEMKKCIRMRTAMKAQLLKPELVCYRGRDQLGCMKAVRTAVADLVMLDAGDVYTAGQRFGLVPIIAEQYDLDGPYYYAVAVAKIQDPDTDMLFVRGKYSCHTGYGHAAGWVMPVNFLLKNDRLRNWKCDGARAASEFFQKSCAPGGLGADFNSGWKQNTLCDLCHGTGENLCRRDHTEDFYGFTGAYRCLVEGGGNIAFIKHTTVFETSNGNNKMWWARNLLSEDYELLCRDGSRKAVEEYETCNLGKVPGNAIVARPDNNTVLEYYISLFIYAQEFYGSKSEEEFKFQMFRSDFPYNDVIFQDAAQQLVPVPVEQRNYKEYLGYDFVHAKMAVDCTAAAGRYEISHIVFISLLAVSLIFKYF